jgi:NAD-dependent SIR2 family protein deacetylase
VSDEGTWSRAAEAIAEAEALWITAGAGMGVDAGLPDFRGAQGFWRAYPPYRDLGLRFEDMANPQWFRRDAELAWGFYGHRLQLYRDTPPHAGFAVLRDWLATREGGVFTSNVDGMFAAAGFAEDQIFEVHGSLHHVQCVTPCTDAVWSAADVQVAVDPETFRAQGPLPSCPHCGGLARPNVLMFGDGGFVDTRHDRAALDHRRLHVRAAGLRAVVIEMGAGQAVPTVRMFGERLQRAGATLVRINPRESGGPRGTLSLPTGAAEALSRLQARVERCQGRRA